MHRVLMPQLLQKNGLLVDAFQTTGNLSHHIRGTLEGRNG